MILRLSKLSRKKHFLQSLDSFRKKLLIILKNQIPRKSENGFLEALLFGYTEDLDPAPDEILR